MCAGVQLALLELLLITHAVWSRYDIRTHRDSITLMPDMYATIDGPVPFSITPVSTA